VRGAVMGLVQGFRVSVASQGCCSPAVHCVSGGALLVSWTPRSRG